MFYIHAIKLASPAIEKPRLCKIPLCAVFAAENDVAAVSRAALFAVDDGELAVGVLIVSAKQCTLGIS